MPLLYLHSLPSCFSSREFLLPLTFYLYTNASQQAAPECKNLTIDQYLIMPIQRVPRHILLLTDLIKHTPPEHPDFAALSKAVERTKEVAVVFNDAKGRALSNTKVCTISQPTYPLTYHPLTSHSLTPHSPSQSLTHSLTLTRPLTHPLIQMAQLQSSLLGCPENFVLNLPGRLLLHDGSMMMSEDKKRSGSKYSYMYLFTGILL